MRRTMAKGSFTVEASLLFPFLILVIFSLLCLALYLHDRAVIAAGACETAGRGAAEKYQSPDRLEEWLEQQTEELLGGRLLCTENIAVNVSVTSKTVIVCCTGRTVFLGGIEIQETGQAERINPVSFIRKSRNLSNSMQTEWESEGIRGWKEK